MAEGRWKWDISNVIYLDEASGGVTNGQHRLLAIARQPDDYKVELVFRSRPVEDILYHDTGIPRTLPDTLTVLGMEHPGFLSAMLNTSTYWYRGRYSGSVMTRAEQVGWLRNNPHAEDAVDATYRSKMGGKLNLILLPAGTIATLWDIAEYAHGGSTVEEFVGEVQRGESDFAPARNLTAKLVASKNKGTKYKINHPDIGFMVARVYLAWLREENITSIFARRSTSVVQLPGWSEWVSENWPEGAYDTRLDR